MILSLGHTKIATILPAGMSGSHYLCPICKEQFKGAQKKIPCGICSSKLHLNCAGLTKEDWTLMYDKTTGISTYCCAMCKTQNEVSANPTPVFLTQNEDTVSDSILNISISDTGETTVKKALKPTQLDNNWDDFVTPSKSKSTPPHERTLATSVLKLMSEFNKIENSTRSETSTLEHLADTLSNIHCEFTKVNKELQEIKNNNKTILDKLDALESEVADLKLLNISLKEQIKKSNNPLQAHPFAPRSYHSLWPDKEQGLINGLRNGMPPLRPVESESVTRDCLQGADVVQNDSNNLEKTSSTVSSRKASQYEKEGMLSTQDIILEGEEVDDWTLVDKRKQTRARTRLEASQIQKAKPQLKVQKNDSFKLKAVESHLTYYIDGCTSDTTEEVVESYLQANGKTLLEVRKSYKTEETSKAFIIKTKSSTNIMLREELWPSGISCALLNKHKDKTTKVWGTKEESVLLKSARPFPKFIISNLHPETMEENIIEHLEEMEVEVINIAQYNSNSKLNISYEIEITRKNSEKILQKQNWPSGVYAKRYSFKNKSIGKHTQDMARERNQESKDN